MCLLALFYRVIEDAPIVAGANREEAYARGGIEAMVEYATPDCVFYADPSWMEDREYRGREAVVAFSRTQTEAFGDYTFEVWVGTNGTLQSQLDSLPYTLIGP